jgi:hypothetical protein
VRAGNAGKEAVTTFDCLLGNVREGRLSIMVLISMCCAGDSVVFAMVCAHFVDDMLLHSALSHSHAHTGSVFITHTPLEDACRNTQHIHARGRLCACARARL